jgi:recombination protein RecT
MTKEIRTQPQDDLKCFLNNHIGVIHDVAARTITPERMVRLVCVAATKQPDLALCTPISILRAMTSAAEFGLEVCSAANEAALVPYNVKVKRDGQDAWEKQAQFVPMYQGLVKKAIESGKVTNIEARVVYTKDYFEYEFGISPTIKHKPHLGIDRGEILAFYAVAFLPTGATQFEVMAKDEVDTIRDKAKVKGIWNDHYAEMGRKTVVRRLYKYIPKSKDMADLLDLQAKQEAGTLDFDNAPIRPGDSLPTSEPQKTLNEDGDIEYFWANEDRTVAKASCEEMAERLLESGMSEKEAGELMADRWSTIGLPDLSPDTWMNRFLGFRERHIKKTV